MSIRIRPLEKILGGRGESTWTLRISNRFSTKRLTTRLNSVLVAQVSSGQAVNEGVGAVPHSEHPDDPHLPGLPHPPHASRHPPLLHAARPRLPTRRPRATLQVQAGLIQLLPA